MKTVTITSQGQITLPASVRRALGLKASDKLDVSINYETGKVELGKQRSIAELSASLTALIPKGVTPVTNVDEYYQAHRGRDLS
ncbi:MAG: AbrB/MazE/SpoVT family DNA-binding domain-containing protein [Candidatus Saccharimonas sp.]